MVRVPGSSGDSGFHRESQEEVQVKNEQGNEMSSMTTSLNASCADQQSARRNSIDVSDTDVDPDPDLEEKPHPPQVSGPAGLESRQDPLTKQTRNTISTQATGSEVGKPRPKTVREKMKKPDDEEDEDHHGSGWSEEDLKFMYHRKEICDFVHQDPVMRILKLIRRSL
ncbi:hypothetical protein PHMEG_00034111 [Phytophthora megakarya]|uniref:Uncharacterized protein n=1 Tax=Phytophthora megakarya TaxID=4795 RepID=A0A225URT3_9STRA|nr:hypothetical protein PHMEG_00034111 [Phytophthora megakarya]